MAAKKCDSCALVRWIYAKLGMFDVCLTLYNICMSLFAFAWYTRALHAIIALVHGCRVPTGTSYEVLRGRSVNTSLKCCYCSCGRCFVFFWQRSTWAMLVLLVHGVVGWLPTNFVARSTLLEARAKLQYIWSKYLYLVLNDDSALVFVHRAHRGNGRVVWYIEQGVFCWVVRRRTIPLQPSFVIFLIVFLTCVSVVWNSGLMLVGTGHRQQTRYRVRMK